MLFNVETDTGQEIVGYVVPDGFDSVPSVAALSGRRVLWSGPASEPRTALVAAGRHRSGLCGYRIGPEQVPGLAAVADLEIRDVETGLSLYRRPGARRPLGRRLFRLETGLDPLTDFDRRMNRLFQVAHWGMEHLGAETATQGFLLTGVDSVYLSGRLGMRAQAPMVERGFDTIVQIRDPFDELALRLDVLSGARGPVEDSLSAREIVALQPALAALEGLDTSDPRVVRRFFRRIEGRVAAALSNPLTRQLTALHPGDLCSGNAVSNALRLLSGFDVVAPAEMEGYLEASVAALLDRPEVATEGVARPEWGPVAAAVSDCLDRVSTVEAMLECDLEVHASVSAVFEGLTAPAAA